ncbi:MAG: PAS domain S-box protein [Candidatus Eisenbacteria bacterium]|nr:PAS domain S-box protein [Candidatus Eisenbacteria bacterium]
MRSSQQPAHGAARGATPEPLRVLIVEDVPADAELMVHELRRAGYAPSWARVDTEADYLARLDPGPDVILADYRLPGFDALSALYHLEVRGLDIPFLIVSGAISEEAAVACMRLGAADHVPKDRLMRLGQAVARALEEKRRRAEKERAEHALRESEERFRLLVEGGEDYAIVMLDPDGRVVSWNPGAERIHGYTAEEILGQPFARFHTPEDVERGKPEQELEVAATEERYEDRGWRVRKDGTRFWADVVITALHHESGELRGFSKVTRDITERRRAEEALARQSQELARAHAELEVFTHVASRDLREPLRAIEAAARRLAERRDGRADVELEASAAGILDAVARMQGLLDELLAYSRAGSGGSAFVATDCGAVLDAALASLRADIEASGARITRGPLPEVTADSGQLVQLFQNLIANAIRYRGSAAPEVCVTAGREGGAWRFRVRDNGPGIPPGLGERVLQLLPRARAGADGRGSGIGLAICRTIVERHGGTIGFDSEPGRGTTFWFTLPEGPHDA